MSQHGTIRETQPRRGTWVGFDPATQIAPLFFDRSSADIEADADNEEVEALADEARHTGMLIAASLTTGIVITWLADLLVGGPGLGAMVGL